MNWEEKRDRCRKAFGERFTMDMNECCKVYSRHVGECDDCSFKEWYIVNSLPRV